MSSYPTSAHDFIDNWIQIQKKEEKHEIIELIEKHLSGINLDQLDEENLLKDLINIAMKGEEYGNH